MPIEIAFLCAVGIFGIIAVIVSGILTHPDNIDKPWRQPMKLWLRNVGIGILLGVVFGLVLGAIKPNNARARDVGQWEASDPAVREWFKSLMQPDNPTVSCCGESDAYWADEIHVRNGKTFATITDDRPDAPLGRPHIPNGTEFEIPNYKLKYDAGNPVGHNLLFITATGHVWCFIQTGGA
jgi:hypothetical protein